MKLSKEEVGLNVKKAREIKSEKIGIKYTQKMLAEETGFSQGYISDIENGRRYPSRDAVLAISDKTGVSMDFILGTANKFEYKNPTNALQIVKETFSEMLDFIYLPVVGDIAAGIPILAEENIERYLPYSTEYDPSRHFVLRVHGDSMVDAGISSGDLVVIRQQQTADNGQIVAIRLKDDGVTLKKFYMENNKIILKPCNSKYGPTIINDNAEIIGVAVSITKKLS